MANRIYTDPTQPGRISVEQEGRSALSIRYNEHTHSLRLHSENEQRVFIIERQPFSARLQLFSEYGIRTGTCRFDSHHPLRGSLEVEGVRMRFRTEGNELALEVDGKAIDRFTWSAAGRSPEELAGILMLVGREELRPPVFASWRRHLG
ncbi:hypothetical protein EPD60_03290 [Flaviaesturariibacter flavus]|uniref:Uncharacterized protein n=1 Tax=Flaviaesturariibacter flavus TaxID=2502780 RepID=A0A4R1BN71_9BACT|nr:hypothetical protein [Flaviaesturariibacter flavus]TCJ18798.1 hypothetical protein EPD60_03290 [Flaviaesturariibacter flavus]